MALVAGRRRYRDIEAVHYPRPFYPVGEVFRRCVGIEAGKIAGEAPAQAVEGDVVTLMNLRAFELFNFGLEARR